MAEDDLFRRCTIDDDEILVPNKGLGRARLAAWLSRHQHPDAGVSSAHFILTEPNPTPEAPSGE